MFKSQSLQCGKEQMVFIEGACSGGREGDAMRKHRVGIVVNLELGCHHLVSERGIKISEVTGVLNAKL